MAVVSTLALTAGNSAWTGGQTFNNSDVITVRTTDNPPPAQPVSFQLMLGSAGGNFTACAAGILQNGLPMVFKLSDYAGGVFSRPEVWPDTGSPSTPPTAFYPVNAITKNPPHTQWAVRGYGASASASIEVAK